MGRVVVYIYVDLTFGNAFSHYTYIHIYIQLMKPVLEKKINKRK